MKIISAVCPAVRSLGKALSITEDVTEYVFEHMETIYKLRVPEHFIFDGASIPRPLWGPLGLPPHGGMDGPALPHDFAYHHRGLFPLGTFLQDDGENGWEMCHEPMPRQVADLLLEALCVYLQICGGFKASLVYWGVKAFGSIAWSRDDKERKDELVSHLAVCPELNR